MINASNQRIFKSCLCLVISSNDDGESSSGSEFETESSRSFQEDDYVAEISRDPIRSTGPLGEWETHTKVD